MIHSVLIIGQSNMAGRGFLDEAENINKSKIKVLRNGRWQPMYRPVNNDRPFSGVCLAESFAEKYAAVYGVTVGIIPCADGGTALSQWQPGEVLYDHAVFQAKLAQRTSTITAVLWHQGEADCSPELYTTYKQRFEVMMNAMREELGLYNVPFILGGLGDFLANCPADESLKNYGYVNDELEKIVSENDMTGFVSAKGLTSNPDFLHFNSKALYKFGIRYFDEFERLTGGRPIAADPTKTEEKLTEMEKL